MTTERPVAVISCAMENRQLGSSSGTVTALNVPLTHADDNQQITNSATTSHTTCTLRTQAKRCVHINTLTHPHTYTHTQTHTCQRVHEEMTLTVPPSVRLIAPASASCAVFPR